MKKKLLSMLILVPLILTGCGSDKKEDTSKIGGTITVVTDRTDADKLFEDIETKFKDKYPEVEDVVFESSNDYANYITTRMNTKNYGDVLFVPFSMNATPEEYENYFEPLGNVKDLEEKYIDVTEADYNGVAYGLPSALNSLGIIYNEDVLKEAGVTKMPTSLDEMIEACEKVKKNTDAIPFYTNYNNTLGVWGGALTSYGGEQYRSAILEKGTAFQEGQPIRQVMDLFYNLSSKGLTEKDPITGDYGKSMQMLAEGKVAMFMMGSQEVPEIQKLATNTSGSTIKIAPFPVKFNGQTSIPFGAPSVVGINKNSENKETAKVFLEFFISNESGYAKEFGGMTPDKNSLTDDEKKMFEENNIILTVPTETPETDKLYSDIANEVGVGRLNDVLQNTINIGLYPNQNKSYDEYIKELEGKWAKAVKDNEK